MNEPRIKAEMRKFAALVNSGLNALSIKLNVKRERTLTIYCGQVLWIEHIGIKEKSLIATLRLLRVGDDLNLSLDELTDLMENKI